MLSMLGVGDASPKPEYSNQIEFIGNPVEIRLRFNRIHPGGGDQIAAEIIMHPMVAKGMARMMMQRIQEWEKDNGEIFMPDDVKLIEDFFRATLHRPGGEEPKDEDK